MHLSGAPFPASKAELLRYTAAHQAHNIIPMLADLPEQEYGSALDVVKAVIVLEPPRGVGRSGSAQTS